MTEFLVKHLVKDYKDIEKVSVRTSYGMLGSVVGIFCNILLFVVKWATGFFLHSVSVMADAFNNLSDAGSSILSMVGVKMASKPADRDHPFGHGRIEYIAALAVSFLVLEVGFTFLKDAIGKIRQPEEMRFQLISIVILLLTICVKLWMWRFNRTLGKRIDSKVMLAASTDAMGDVVTTSATILSVLFWKVTGINIDGFVGIAVALVIMWAGVGIAKDTLEPLIGQAIPLEEYNRITRFVENYDGIFGSHDLIVHNYGPTRRMASIHAEVPNDVDIETSHEIIDRIEHDAMEKLGVFLVIHMDPIETKNKEVLKTKEKVAAVLEAVDPAVSIHDFRMISGEEQINLIFDMVVPFEYDEKKQEEITTALIKLLQVIDKRYQCVITVERSFIAN
jgi:cation diffusion facilitator family transporter